MVLNFVDNYIQSNYEIPKKPCEVIPSTDEVISSTDHEIVRQLNRYAKEFAHDSSIIEDIMTKGFALGYLLDIFPATSINTPDGILSLLFNLGIVTIDGTYQSYTRFVITNEAVRNQMQTNLQIVLSPI